MEIDKIENFLLDIAETEEYKSIEYLTFSIRKPYLDYLSNLRVQKFKIPRYLQKLFECVNTRFSDSEIIADDMLENDINGWVNYYTCVFLTPVSAKISEKQFKCDRNLFILVLTGYILDHFRSNMVDIQTIVDGEIFAYETNQYRLSVVNGVEFKRDYFIYDNKAYLYNILTNTREINFGDDMPGFARIITEQIRTGDILLRLDERLSLPVEQAISYSTWNFEKFRGPQFHFKDSILKTQKTIIEHINNESLNKLLMVIKRDYDSILAEPLLHIELETLPYIGEQTEATHCITTFLHGIYYPDRDYFTHIDYTRNQYSIKNYINKYNESASDIPVDFYAEKDLHYKIWCVENGQYSRKTWYDLMVVSLAEEYQELLNEILA